MTPTRQKPLFSICHTSARPDQWRKVYNDWMQHCEHPEIVEYVLCIDPRWGFSENPDDYASALDNIHVVKNTGRRCYVDGVNIAAAASEGQILIVNADDQFSAPSWDTRLLRLVTAGGVQRARRVAQSEGIGDFCIEVSTGTPDEHQRAIMVMPILSRYRYERLGKRVFFKEYESMFADNDFCEQNRLLGVIDGRHMMFPHRSPLFDSSGQWLPLDSLQADEALKVQNRKEAYQIGAEVFKRRRAAKFADRRTIALCLTGEEFSGTWFDCMMSLQAHLIELDFNIIRMRAFTSNVYMSRQMVFKTVMDHNPRPDLCLWIDDDNPLTVAHFDQLLQGLDARPHVDGMAGWCWIHNEKKTGLAPSVGVWAPDHLHWNPFPVDFAKGSQPQTFECGGLPCILMRMSALEKAGESAFLPFLDNGLETGMMGEDFAFFKRAEAGGAVFMVDPLVRVPHLKLVEVEPIFPDEGLPSPVKVACMMRVKNEARWIKRTIDSVRELCGEHIYVMEDGSTDNTREIAEAAGAVVLDSPFVGQGLDEKRDKNWLLKQVEERCSPDWIFMPDGDEELEAGGCAKIRLALEQNPPVDCFAVRFLFLWDAPDKVRVDGVYGSMLRQSLFRAGSGLEFRSYYEGKDENHNHVGLHTSNAPGLGGMRVKPLNVFLLHYGYLHKEDRIRKYRWIISIDPHNAQEDFYRHTVQGDIPEVPADERLRHGGPLQLRQLPPHLIPKFDVVPGPREPDWTSEKVAETEAV